MSNKIFLRAGFEPATYGLLNFSHHYSPPLYQLSYQRSVRERESNLLWFSWGEVVLAVSPIVWTK